MSEKELQKFLKKNKQEVEQIMKKAEEASKRFDDIVRDIRQHC